MTSFGATYLMWILISCLLAESNHDLDTQYLFTLRLGFEYTVITDSPSLTNGFGAYLNETECIIQAAAQQQNITQCVAAEPRFEVSTESKSVIVVIAEIDVCNQTDADQLLDFLRGYTFSQRCYQTASTERTSSAKPTSPPTPQPDRSVDVIEATAVSANSDGGNGMLIAYYVVNITRTIIRKSTASPSAAPTYTSNFTWIGTEDRLYTNTTPLYISRTEDRNAVSQQQEAKRNWTILALLAVGVLVCVCILCIAICIKMKGLAEEWSSSEPGAIKIYETSISAKRKGSAGGKFMINRAERVTERRQTDTRDRVQDMQPGAISPTYLPDDEEPGDGDGVSQTHASPSAVNMQHDVETPGDIVVTTETPGDATTVHVHTPNGEKPVLPDTIR